MNNVELSKFAPSAAHLSNDFSFEPLLDSQEAARLLRIHPKTLQRMARNGEVVGIQIGKLWRFRASELELWLRKRIAG
jgi:excisionase family DNA binding protein